MLDKRDNEATVEDCRSEDAGDATEADQSVGIGKQITCALL